MKEEGRRAPGGPGALADAAISFDFDGVLVRSPFGHGVLLPVLRRLAAASAPRAGCAPDEAERRVRELAWAEFGRRTARGDGVRAYDWQAIIEVVARSVGERFDGSLAEMTREYGRTLARTADRSLVYPHAHEVLTALRTGGACLLLLTNGLRDYQLPLARALGLEGCFNAILASDDLGAVKPQPEAFEKAFRACPAGARRYHVGDTLGQDVAGARACGIFAIWIVWDLPEELSRLAPAERALSPALGPVLAARLEHERSLRGVYEPEPREAAPVRPDAVIRSLEEVEAVVSRGRDRRGVMRGSAHGALGGT